LVTPIRIAFWGNFGTLNLGNECTLAAAVENLRRKLPGAGLICICAEPVDAAVRHGLPAVAINGIRDRREVPAPRLQTEAAPSGTSRFLRRIFREAGDWLRVLRLASTFDALLITGTGVITDHGEGALGLPYELFKWSICTRLRRRELLFLSVGVESIATPLGAFFLKSALQLADYRCYRDTHSRQLLETLHFSAERDGILPDLAFSLPVNSVALPASASTSGVAARRIVAVGVFNYRERGRAGGTDRQCYERYLESLTGLILWLLQQGWAIRVIVGDAAYDPPVCLDLRARLAALGCDPDKEVFQDEPADSFQTLLSQLAPVEFVIATRFHNLLLALLLGKPVISLSYEGKNEALMRQMGLERYCQALDNLDLERLMGQFREIQEWAEQLRPLIRERVADNRRRLEEEFDRIVTRLGGTPPTSGSALAEEHRS
jgi:polysaccharide pyruvyl transferase WcaK-like protein